MTITYKEYNMNFDADVEPTDAEQVARILYTNWVDDHHRDSRGRSYNDKTQSQAIAYCEKCVTISEDNILKGALFYRKMNANFNSLEAVWIRPPVRGEGYYKIMLEAAQQKYNCQVANVSGYIYENDAFLNTIAKAGFCNRSVGIDQHGNDKYSLCTNKAISFALAAY